MDGNANERFTDYRMKSMCSRLFAYIDLKSIVVVLAVELGMMLVALYKGCGVSYIPVSLVMMLFTVVGCIGSTFAKADKKLFIIVIVLLNLGFLVQNIQDRGNGAVISALIKLVVVLGSAVIAFALYSRLSKWISEDKVVIGMMFLQYGISIAVLFLGQLVGDRGDQGATISIAGTTPFEFVKIMYIFVAAGLLCKDSDTIKIIKWEINRGIILFVHTAILSIVFVLCSELGTLMIVYITGLIMLHLFGSHNRWTAALKIVSAAGFVIVWLVSAKILFPIMLQNEGALPGIVSKIVRRFGAVFHPELYMNDYGYQGTKGLMSIAIGGWFGIGTERHRIDLPEANNDFIFANIIETCGISIGIILIIFILTFVKRSTYIAEKCENNYSKGVAVGIACLIAVESIIHIGYNMALLPITGIPLYFLSQGFSAIVTSMSLVAILLVISTKIELESEETLSKEMTE